MTSTFETVANIISEVCDVPRELIKPESHVTRDLNVDSLNFLDAVFSVDQHFGITIPLEDWTQEVNEGKSRGSKYFVLENFCAEVDRLVAATKSVAAG